ncbi:G patch domain-containing protein 11 [Leucoagaricus sp. SymC.cos]|nr:G patch domain-containing protein 11 [Leucoagaricus sp. SymC.cos]
MSDDDDYFSDKYLAEATHDLTGLKTYSQLRKEALKKSHDRNVRNRTKSRRQRELESREEGLNRSLFEKAQEEEETGSGSGSKALAMMMKMGFTPGQSLGRQPETQSQKDSDTPVAAEGSYNRSPSPAQHKTEPLPINEWLGKKGIGAMKRACSPGTNERITKMAKMEEEASHRSFRDRARQEYEERKAEAKLGPAQRTCFNLDEKTGKTLNVLWLNPSKPETFPSGMMEALALHHEQYVQATVVNETIQERLRRQMQADALSAPIERDQEDGESGGGIAMTATSDKDKKKLVDLNQEYDFDFLEEAVQFLRLQPQDRLHLVLSYLRATYAYCFYCGTEYESQEEMATQCPGPEEDDHD